MSVFVTTNDEVDADSLEQEGIEALEAGLEGWKPAEGDPLVWANKAFSRMGAGVFEQAATMERGAFKGFGEAIVSVPPVQAAPATVESVWTMIDAEGHEIPAGTQVTIADGDTPRGFITVGSTTISEGSEKATILLQAVEAGEAANELTADPELSDALVFVEGISLEGSTTANGVDEEDEDTYLVRLVETIQLLSLSLIIGRDFEIDARAVPGIARAKCIEAYNAETKASNKPLVVSVFPIDEDGEPLSAGVKKELKERQLAKVPSEVLVFVADPEYTGIDVEATIKIQEGFDPALVIADVEARLNEYLSPANWGLPTTDTGKTGWVNKTTLYRFELISEIDRVGGVERVASLKMAKAGKELKADEEITLTGAAALTKAGTLKVKEA